MTAQDTPTLTNQEIDEIMTRMASNPSAQKMVALLVSKYEYDQDLAKQLAQDVWERVWAQRYKFAGASKASTWVTAVAHNVCKNYLRSIARSPKLVQSTSTLRCTEETLHGDPMVQVMVDEYHSAR